MSATLAFDNTPQATALQRELRERVDAYFEERGLSKHADARMWAKTAFFLGGAAALLALLASGALPVLAAAPVCVLLGVFVAGIGFNIGHDAIHGAYSDKPWVNRLLSHSFDIAGASSFTWSTAHNFVHHTYTNVPGVDHDLEPGPFMLFYPRERPAWIYRYQHIYSFFLYLFALVVWIFKKDFIQAIEPDPRTGKRARKRDIAGVVAWKLLHWGLFLGLPMAVSGYAWWQVVIGYFISVATTGLVLGIVFQLAHVVEATAFPVPQPDGAGPPRIHDSWAAHQLRTTANFAVTSWLANFFTGGLNHQIEHHLFSRICHIHYVDIAPIVREVALAHGLPHHENPTFFGALASHVRMMKRFGRPAAAASSAPTPAASALPSLPSPLPAQ